MVCCYFNTSEPKCKANNEKRLKKHKKTIWGNFLIPFLPLKNIIGDATAMEEKFDLVIMDPPRAGASIEFLRSLVTLSPEKVVYVSCNPETLSRDLSFLTRKGYKVQKIQPVDMFHHTEHLETVVLLGRK